MKEYLKMIDCFEMPLSYAEASNGMHSMIDSAGDGISCEFLCDAELEVVLHSINSHDELVAEVERLRGMVIRMQTYLDMAGEYPEKESDNPLRQWLFDAIDFTK